MGSHSQAVVRRGGSQGGRHTRAGDPESKVKCAREPKRTKRGSSEGFFQQRRDLEENILVGQRDRLQSGSLRSKLAVQVTKLNLQRISSIQKLRSRKHET